MGDWVSSNEEIEERLRELEESHYHSVGQIIALRRVLRMFIVGVGKQNEEFRELCIQQLEAIQESAEAVITNQFGTPARLLDDPHWTMISEHTLVGLKELLGEIIEDLRKPD